MKSIDRVRREKFANIPTYLWIEAFQDYTNGKPEKLAELNKLTDAIKAEHPKKRDP